MQIRPPHYCQTFQLCRVVVSAVVATLMLTMRAGVIVLIVSVVAALAVAGDDRKKPATSADNGPVSADVVRKANQYMAFVYQARRLVRAGKTADAIAAYEKALAYARKEVPFFAANSLEELAPLYVKTKSYPKARDAWQELLSSRIKEHGPDTPEVADARWKLVEIDVVSKLTDGQLQDLERAANLYARGVVLDRQKKYKEAMPLAREALQIRQRILADRHIATAISLRHVGWLIAMMGDEPGAASYYETSLAICRTLLGPRHQQTKASAHNVETLFGNLAEAAMRDGKYAVAEQHWQKTLNLRERNYGTAHHSVVDAKWGLADARRLMDSDENARANDRQIHDRYSKVIALSRAGRNEEANELAATLVDQCTNHLGEHPLTAKAISLLGSSYAQLGNHDAALEQHRRSLELKRHVFGARHPETAISLANVALALQKKAEWAESEELLRQHLALRRRIHGDVHADVASAQIALGELLLLRAIFAEAKTQFHESLGILRKVSPDKLEQAGLIKRNPDKVICLLRLAQVYHYLAGEVAAKPYFEYAKHQAEKTYGRHDPRTANVLVAVARNHNDVGGYFEAEAFARVVLSIQRKIGGAESAVSAQALLELGNALDHQYRHEGALSCFRQAVEICRARLGDNHTLTAEASAALGRALTRRGHFAEARPLLNSALDVYENAKRPNELGLARALNDVGRLDVEQGQYANAERHLRRSLDRFLTALPHWPEKVVQTKINLAAALFAQDRLDEARELIRQVNLSQISRMKADVARLSETESIAYVHRIASGIGPLFSTLQQSDPAESELAYRSVWETRAVATRAREGYHLIFKNREIMANPNAHILVDNFGSYQETRARLAALAMAPVPKDKHVEHAERLAELTDRKEMLEKALVPLVALLSRRRASEKAGPANLARQLPKGMAVVDIVPVNRWERVDTGKLRTESHYEAFVLRSQETPKGYSLSWRSLGPRRFIDQAVRRWRGQIRGLATAVAEKGELTRDPATELRELVWEQFDAQLAGVQTVILIPDGYLTQVPWAALPGKRPGTYLVEDYGICLANHGHQVLRLIGEEPLSKSPNLLVVGDIDFGMEPNRPDATLIAGTTPRSIRRGLVFEMQRPKWPSLPGTSQEAAAISQIWNRPGTLTYLSRLQATEENVKSMLPKSRYVHLSTHGYFAGKQFRSTLRVADDSAQLSAVGRALIGNTGNVSVRNPLLLSAIVLARANQPVAVDEDGVPTTDDGYLTAEEVFDLDLSQTELVVLAACETGLGDVADKEGVLGLQRALHMAGARSVIASWWKVEDRATQLLMRRFYTNLWGKKLSKLEALREAQLWMLHHPEELESVGVEDVRTRGEIRRLKSTNPIGSRAATGNRTDPYYWAGFQLSGNWR